MIILINEPDVVPTITKPIIQPFKYWNTDTTAWPTYEEIPSNGQIYTRPRFNGWFENPCLNCPNNPYKRFGSFEPCQCALPSLYNPIY